MIKRFLSILLALALSMTMFTFVASAEEAFTIQWANDPENHAFSSTYSPYTLAGTEMTVSPTVSLKDGQEIHWFLNGNKVGTSGLTEDDYAANFTFKSVDGTNAVQAKVMEGDSVVATSNTIEKAFTPIVKSGSNIFSDSLSSFNKSNYYYGEDQNWKTFVTDPDGVSDRKVMKLEKPSSGAHSSLYSRIPGSNWTTAQTASGIVRIDYKIFVDNVDGSINLAYLRSGCGCNQNAELIADWPYGAFVGNARDRSGILAKGEWVDVNIVVDNATKTYDVTVGGVQAVTGHKLCSNNHDSTNVYLCAFDLPVFYLAGETGKNAVFYLKDVNIYKCTTPGISITSSLGNAKAVAGSKVVINAESTFDNASIVYWCNGVKYEDNKVLASAGTNTVYAQAIGESGNVLGTSETVTFEAYADTFKSASKTVTVGTYSNPGNGASIPDIGRKYNGEIDTITGATRLYYNSIDVKPEIISGTFNFLSTFKAVKGELYPAYFKFTSGNIQVAKTVEANGITVSEYVNVPYDASKDTYNVKTIYDPLYGSCILLVDDVIYSVIDVSATVGTSNDLTPTNTYFYLDPSMSASSDETTPNKVTLTNYEEGYSALPAAHSKVDYINNEKIVTNTSELTNADDLTVKFVAFKGEFNEVLCIATVLEKGGELISLATKDVTFDDTKDSEEVSLILENLPSDIAVGNKYSVNVMLWNKDDLKPIVTKIVMP